MYFSKAELNKDFVVSRLGTLLGPAARTEGGDVCTAGQLSCRPVGPVSQYLRGRDLSGTTREDPDPSR